MTSGVVITTTNALRPGTLERVSQHAGTGAAWSWDRLRRDANETG
jgi:hypothetical protein